LTAIVNHDILAFEGETLEWQGQKKQEIGKRTVPDKAVGRPLLHPTAGTVVGAKPSEPVRLTAQGGQRAE